VNETNPSVPPAQSPTTAIAEATTSSLDELFSRDPLELSRQDRDQIISELRKRRVQWAQDEAAGKTRASRPKKEEAPTQAAPANLSLEDLL